MPVFYILPFLKTWSSYFRRYTYVLFFYGLHAIVWYGYIILPFNQQSLVRSCHRTMQYLPHTLFIPSFSDYFLNSIICLAVHKMKQTRQIGCLPSPTGHSSMSLYTWLGEKIEIYPYRISATYRIAAGVRCAFSVLSTTTIVLQNANFVNSILHI